MQGTEKQKIVDYIEHHLTEKRRIHTYGVAQEARALAIHWGEDPEKAELAALFHDFCKSASHLTHGELAAKMMKEEYGITDEDMLHAVHYHTTGRPGMSLLEKIIFLADAVEPNRTYSGVKEIRDLAYKNLNRACILAMERTIAYVKEKGLFLDEMTELAKEDLTKEEERKEHEK